MVCYGRFQEEREEVKTQKPSLLPEGPQEGPAVRLQEHIRQAGDSFAKWDQKSPLRTRNLENTDNADGDYKHPLSSAEIIGHPCVKIMTLYLVPYHKISQK